MLGKYIYLLLFIYFYIFVLDFFNKISLDFVIFVVFGFEFCFWIGVKNDINVYNFKMES